MKFKIKINKEKTNAKLYYKKNLLMQSFNSLLTDKTEKELLHDLLMTYLISTSEDFGNVSETINTINTIPNLSGYLEKEIDFFQKNKKIYIKALKLYKKLEKEKEDTIPF